MNRKFDDAYLVLRNLLKARLVSSQTRASAKSAIQEINKEALVKSMLTREEDVLERPPKAA